jgi:hypothetical protein
MKYFLTALVLLNLSCQKEEKISPTSKAAPVMLRPASKLTIQQFYCGSFARGCEDYSEDSVYVNIVDGNKIHVARRFSEASSPFSWGFSGDFDKSKTSFLLKTDPAFSKAIDKLTSGAVSNEGKYSDPINITFKCEADLKSCTVSGVPAEMPESAFESAMLSFDLKCNQVALKDESATNCN